MLLGTSMQAIESFEVYSKCSKEKNTTLQCIMCTMHSALSGVLFHLESCLSYETLASVIKV
jgi:hypothetical protein